MSIFVKHSALARLRKFFSFPNDTYIGKNNSEPGLYEYEYDYEYAFSKVIFSMFSVFDWKIYKKKRISQDFQKIFNKFNFISNTYNKKFDINKFLYLKIFYNLTYNI